MSLTLPLESDLPDFDFDTELDGLQFNLRFRLNLRDGGWYFDLAAADGTLLVAGARLVLNRPLLRRYTSDKLPPGELVAWSDTGDDSEPGPTDLGTRVQLLYYAAAELK